MTNTKTKTRRSTEKWSAILEALNASDKTVKEFCAQERIHPSQIYFWRKRLTPSNTSVVKSAGPFIELQTSPDSAVHHGAAVSISTQSGQQIFISELPSSSYMVDLIRGL